MDEFTRIGNWWAPNNSRQVGGTLTFDNVAGLGLRLAGSIGDELDSQDTWPVLFGRLSSGERVTLYECVASRTTTHINTSGLTSEQTIAAIYAHFGEHVEDPTAWLCSRCTIELAELGRFATAPKWRVDRSTYRIEPAAPKRLESVGRLSDVQLTFATDVLVSDRGNGDLDVRYTPFIVILPDKPTPIDTVLDAFVGPVRKLVSLAVCRSVTFKTLSMDLSRKRAATSPPASVDRVFAQRTGAGFGSGDDVLFTLDEIASSLDRRLEQWFSACTESGPAIELFLSVLGSEDLPMEHAFLFCAQALETYHRRTVGGTEMAQEQFKRWRTDLQEHLPRVYRKFVMTNLAFANEPKFNTRLHDLLIEGRDGQSMAPLISGIGWEPTDLIRLIKANRNYYAL